MKQKEYKSKGKITKIEVTTDTMTGRAGMALFVMYSYRLNAEMI